MDSKRYKFADISKYRNQIYGVCTIMIVMFHLRSIGGTLIHNQTNAILRYIEFVNEAGSLAVDVFLLLSGVGLYFSYSKKQDATVFVKSRVRRLAPAFIGIIIPMSMILLVIDRNINVFILRITACIF